MSKVPRLLLVMVPFAFVIAYAILLGIVWSPVPPYALNVVGMPESRERVVIYPKEPPAFNPPEHDVRWFSLHLLLEAPQSLNANVGVYARTEDPAQDPSCAPLTARLRDSGLEADFFAYVCAVGANDSKVGEALFENAKYASLKRESGLDTSKIIEGIQGGKLWLGVDPSGLPPTPLTLKLRLLGAGYVLPSPRPLNIALMGLFLFLMGQAIYHLAGRARSKRMRPWRMPLRHLGRLSTLFGLGVVFLETLLDVLNNGPGGLTRPTLFAGLSAFSGAPWVFLNIFDTENSPKNKAPFVFLAIATGFLSALGLILLFSLHFLPNHLALLASSMF